MRAKKCESELERRFGSSCKTGEKSVTGPFGKGSILGDALVGGAIDDINGVEGRLGLDVAVGGALEEVEAVDAVEINAGEIAEGALDTTVDLVDDVEAAAKDVATAMGLTLSGADIIGVGQLGHAVQSFQGGMSFYLASYRDGWISTV